jgi:hypothetical protein
MKLVSKNNSRKHLKKHFFKIEFERKQVLKMENCIEFSIGDNFYSTILRDYQIFFNI